MYRIITILLALLMLPAAYAGDFGKCFSDTTLMLDVSVTTSGPRRGIALPYFSKSAGWYGRRVNLAKMEYPSNLEFTITDDASGEVIYAGSKFMALNDFRHPTVTGLTIPAPRRTAWLNIVGHYYTPVGYRDIDASFLLDPAAIASMPVHRPAADVKPVTLRKADNPLKAINLAIIGDGYTAEELPDFLHHAEQFDSILFTHEAFADNSRVFNVVAIPIASAESGVSRPSKHVRRNTLLGSHFDSFQLDRLLTLPHPERATRVLEGLPNAHIIILGNTDCYGGSGPYHDYCIGSSRNPWWMQVIVHEFAHSFGRLGDEYEAGNGEIYYPADEEPPEPNITTLHDFSGKWQPLIDAGKASLIEGAGYQPKGVYRGCENCLMRALGDYYFCPICTEALKQTILFLTEEQ